MKKKLLTLFSIFLVSFTLVGCSTNLDGKYVANDKATNTKGKLEIKEDNVKLEVTNFFTAIFNGKLNKSENTMELKGGILFAEEEKTFKYKVKNSDTIIIIDDENKELEFVKEKEKK